MRVMCKMHLKSNAFAFNSSRHWLINKHMFRHVWSSRSLSRSLSVSFFLYSSLILHLPLSPSLFLSLSLSLFNSPFPLLTPFQPVLTPPLSLSLSLFHQSSLSHPFTSENADVESLVIPFVQARSKPKSTVLKYFYCCCCCSAAHIPRVFNSFQMCHPFYSLFSTSNCAACQTTPN